MRSVRKRLSFRRLKRVPGRTTERWSVVNRDSKIRLGIVQWFGRWRQYTFDPANALTFEKNCLRSIAAFCEQKTVEHYRVRRAQV